MLFYSYKEKFFFLKKNFLSSIYKFNRCFHQISYEKSLTMQINPNFIVGFIDGEGCFNISITKNSKMSVGYNVQVKMHITQNTTSVKVLHLIKDFFGCGSMVIHNKTGDRMRFQITGLKDINNILIPFLDKYTLLSSKFLNYQDFKKAVKLINNKEHLTLEGIQKLKYLSKNMNTGRSFEDKFNFCKSYFPTMPITPEWWIHLNFYY
jgi:hypothetical protein